MEGNVRKKTLQEQPPTFISDGAILETEKDDTIIEDDETMNSDQETENAETASVAASDAPDPGRRSPAAPVAHHARVGVGVMHL